LLLGAVSCADDSVGPAGPSTEDGKPALAAMAAPLSFIHVSGGASHSCGVTLDNRLYCWGSNDVGQLGDGTRTSRNTPVRVATTLTFRQVSAGYQSTCAVTTGDRVYCWGDNFHGQLGDGSGRNRLTPGAVAGTRRFRQVETRNHHTCAVAAADSRAWCWGLNSYGQLGDGTIVTRTRPVAVASTLSFKVVRTGNFHSCGVTSNNRAFCWGRNNTGQLGDRSETVARRLRPYPVADGHQFIQLAAGPFHNCAVTSDRRAYCWGNGRNGQLGNGAMHLSWWPRAVKGGLTFDRVTAGGAHSCGKTPAGRAYCWGLNLEGALGDGTTEFRRLTPVAVAGGHLFRQLSAGGSHTCGKTDTDKGYCWGDNSDGQLGDGTRERRLTPTAVAGPA
jgi:alpha-tubulin suppressor-like RCC1 family protein